MKSLKKILSEVSQPKGKEEKAFKDQHVVDVIDHPAAEKSQFTGEIEGKTKKKRIADYYAGDDVKAYDQAYSQKDKPFKMPRNESTDDVTTNQVDEETKQYIEIITILGAKKRVPVDASKAFDALNHYKKQPSTRSARIVSEDVINVDEKIDLVKAKMGDVIKDFQASDAPQFAGKSKEERQKMAIAAKLSAERDAKKEAADKFVSDDGVSYVPHPVEPEGHKSKKLSFKDMLNKVTQTEETTEITEDADEEIEMMEGQLHFIIYAAEEIMEYLDMVDDPEEWYQNKLSGVFYEMKALHSYAEGEKRMYDMEPTDMDHVGDVYGYGEEVEQSEEEGDELTEAMKAGTLKLKNGDAVKLSEKDAKLLNKMLGELNEKNRKQMEQALMSDKNGFNEILSFAKEAM